MRLPFASISVLLFSLTVSAGDLYWPTPNDSFLKGEPQELYLQPTSSGRLESALWGCTRNGGARFHEGIDLKATRWSRSGESTDPIFAAMAGEVVHINAISGKSNYGKYMVLRHLKAGLEVYTLYSHLSKIAENLKIGDNVVGGQEIGIMGRSSAGYRIPKSRAHLHFEIGFRLTRSFDKWYRQQDFTTPNEHRSWNGMNLVGLDPIAYYEHSTNNPDTRMHDYLANENIAFTIHAYFKNSPDFLNRNPSFFLNNPSSNADAPAGWYRIQFTWYGLPLQWTYLGNREPQQPLIIEEVIEDRRCRNFISSENESPKPTRNLERLIALLRS